MLVTFQCRILGFWQDFTQCEINEVHDIVKVTFFETHMIDMRCKLVSLRRICDVP